MGLQRIIAPATTPVTLTEAKAHLRVSHTDEDALITLMIGAATEYVETLLGRSLNDQTWELVLDAFPASEIRIPRPPLIEVVSIRYVDAGGIEQLVDPADYYVDTTSRYGWVVPQGGSLTWPETIDAINSVRVRFRAGYQSADSPPSENIPPSIKQAMLLILGAMYENREETVVGTIAVKLPWGASEMLLRHRVEMSMA